MAELFGKNVWLLTFFLKFLIKVNLQNTLLECYAKSSVFYIKILNNLMLLDDIIILSFMEQKSILNKTENTV